MPEIKIACLNNISAKGLEVFTPPYVITSDPAEATAWMVRSKALHAVMFPEPLLAIARAGAGVNNIPLSRCVDEGVVVFNAPGANANAVKELVIASSIVFSRNLDKGMAWTRAQSPEGIVERTEQEKKAFVGSEIRGKTLGVIGLGAVGHLVANAALSMGMKVIGYDPSISLAYALRLSSQVQLVKQLEEMLPLVDFLTLHIPLTPKTEKSFGAAQISRMKKGAVLLNFSRDRICDEDAVEEALESGQLRGYVVDFPNERNMTFPNTILTPHIGASTEESEELSAHMAAEEVREYLETGNIHNSVNFPEIDGGPLQAESRLIVLHRNQPGVISHLSTYLSERGLNIRKMASNSRGDVAVALVDIDGHVEESVIRDLQEALNNLRVRVLYHEVEE